MHGQQDIKNDSDVCHPRCVLYNSKELGVLILTIEHNYICLYYYKEDIITTTCFGPICGPSSGCDLDFWIWEKWALQTTNDIPPGNQGPWYPLVL